MKNKKNADSATEKQMENFFEMHKSRFQELLKDLITSLQIGIGNLPKEHFDELRNKLFEEILSPQRHDNASPPLQGSSQ